MRRGPGKGLAAAKVALKRSESFPPLRLTRSVGRRTAIGMLGVLLLPAVLFAAKEKKAPRVVSGAVLDGSDNPIVGASVQLKDLRGGKTLAMYTQQGGQYQFSDLNRNHDYEVQASYKGVSSEVRTASSFDDRNRIVLNLHILPPKD